jgi:transcriptional regulator with XRE-family HTH domain
MCLKKHYICLKQHIYAVLASQRRRLGLSQQELAARAGLRREKVNRVESKGEDVSVEELSRLLDAVGLALVVQEKSAAPLPQAARQLVPREFDKAAFIDGSKVKILDWGKVPK